MRPDVVGVPPRASRHRLTIELFAARPGQRVKPPKGGGARPAGMNPTRDAIPPRGSNPDWASSLACRSSELIQRRAGLPRASRTGARMPVAPDPSTTVGVAVGRYVGRTIEPQNRSPAAGGGPGPRVRWRLAWGAA